MSNEFVLMYLLVLAAVGVYAVILYLLEVRSQRRFFAEHPEYPSPFERRTPAE